MSVNSRRDRLMPNAVAGTLQTVATGLILVLLYRFLIEHLGAEVFGEWSLMLSIFGSAHIMNLGLAGSGLKLTTEALAESNFSSARKYTRWSILGTALLTVPGIAVAAFIAPSLMKIVVAGSPLFDLGVLGAVGAAIWLGAILQSLRSAVDSLERVDLRQLTVGTQALIFMLLCWALVPPFGFHGLVAAFLFASATAAIIVATILYRLWRHIPQGESVRPQAFRLLNMVRYGIPFNLTNIASLLCDPLTKYLLGVFGSLGAVAWYEMASRVVILLRGLLVSAMEALVPYVAKMNTAAAGDIVAKYKPVLKMSLVVSGPLFTALIAAAPFISWILIGAENTQFIVFLQLLSIAWFINTLSAPAYFFALGLGRQRWNLIAQVLTAVFNIALSSALGLMWGAFGVVLGFSLAVSAGSILQMTGFHRSRGLGLCAIVSWDLISIMFAGSTILCLAIGILWWVVSDTARLTVLVMGVGVASLASLTPLFDPVFGSIVRTFLRIPASKIWRYR